MKVISTAVEVSPVGTKSPAAVGERISKDGRYDLGAAAPSLTTSSLQGRSRGSAFTPKLIEVLVRFELLVQYSYPHASFEVQWRRLPCARESSCFLARLPR